ncbi:hypothetical protein Micbo1qcDRAFT_195811 [Microdochium bolleyi]|uniref:Uncharacterized protein n=1 Tax=Microdochium bolleyi TaxID=196109 RepID=A0A136J1C0_9PEZI|nr:hypothetical protein Micbo1qcDRAFT_195811 [Microdochium bolleyi]
MGLPSDRKTTALSEIEAQPVNKHEQWRLRQTVGKYGTFIILSGAITIPILLALLVALWAGGNGGEGGNAPTQWRYIVIRGWFTEAVTLLSTGISVLTGLQSLICTSLSAAVILETAGVPISQVAEISTMRGVNDGPWRLIFLSLTSSWRKMSLPQNLLVLILYLSVVATKFGSTILVTDLSVTAIVGHANMTYYNLTISKEAFNYKPFSVMWYVPPVYMTFAEVPPTIDPTPSPQGFSDSGNTKRFFMPLGRDNITSLRGYDGAAYGWNSRVSCMPPKMRGRFNISDPGRTTLPYTLSLKGNISYEDTFAAAGVPQVPLYKDGACLPQNFNCTMVVASNVGSKGLSLCVPTVANTVETATMRWLSDPREEPVNANSMVFLVSKTNGTHYNWTSVIDFPQLPSTSVQRGEWTEWTLRNGTKYSASLCFMSSVWERSNIKASTVRDTWNAKPAEQPGLQAYDTSSLRTQLGTTTPLYSNMERGILSVDSVTNTTWGTNNTLYLDTSTYYLFGGGRKAPEYDFVMLTASGGSGVSTVNPYMDFSGILEDVLDKTGRPALALQAMLGIKAYNTFHATAMNRINPEPVHVTSTIMTQAPVRWTGLLCFTAIVVLNYLSVIAITATFLLRTRYSKQGHFWHTISQVITEDTIPLLQHASESRDDHAMARSCLGSTSGSGGREDPVVVVARSGKTGRVQIIRKDELRRGS